MELRFPTSEPATRTMTPEPTVPQKRKSISEDEPMLRDASQPPSTASHQADEDDEAGEDSAPPNEYQTGRVTCEDCGKRVSFRDDITGGFTVKHWDLHRQECPNASQTVKVADPVIYTPETQGEPAVPQVKRRRAKRTEDERIDYLRSDPFVAQFEAYRVLCASCDKWIRLRPNSTYCSIPWDAHRKSCLNKKAAKFSASDECTSVFLTDPQVREYDGDRVRCKICDAWVTVGHEDIEEARQTWLHHRDQCLQSRNTMPSTPTAPMPVHSSKLGLPSIDSVPPASKHLMTLVSSGIPHTSQHYSSRPTVGRSTTAVSTSSVSTVSPTFKDLNPSNFAPSQESRRRNAEQRAASLRADPYIGEVEPNRVFCTICKKWVQLRQDSTYCAYPWVQHRDKCLKRQQRRAQKQADLAEYRAQMEALRREEQAAGRSRDQDELDSEDSSASGEDELRARRRAQRREERRRARQEAEADRYRRMEEQRHLLRQKEAALMHCSDEDAEGESDAEYDLPLAQFADLGSLSGRLEFVSTSIRYLFKTTYEHTDELTIASLVTYLNAAIPPDKHEDFDTTEVTKAAMVLRDRGEFIFEGDVLRQA